VTNGGNTPVDTRIAFKDQDGALSFEPQDGAATLQPGTSVESPVLINGPRRWCGRTERLPFSAVVTPASAQPPITLNGIRQQTAVFPWWIPPAAVAIVALTIALVALLKPGTPRVPVIGNADQLTAVKQLEDAHYIPEVLHQTDNNIAPGLAIGTDPKGSTELEYGQIVKLYVSAGKCEGPCPVQIEVPNIVGLSVTDAQARLEQMNFTVRTVRQSSDDQPIDQVLASDPKATTPRPPNSEVLLTVSAGSKNPPPGPGVSPGAGASPGANTPPGRDTPPSTPIEVPALRNRSVEEATQALEGQGLKAKTVIEHSNAVTDGQVLFSTPAAGSKVNPGSEVTLTVAKNTTPLDLIATADQAAWASGSGKLTFPGKETDKTGFVRQRADTLPNGTIAKVLETNPQNTGFITGIYKLEEPAVPGDHVLAQVGVLKGPASTAGGAGKGTGTVIFQVKANGQVIQQVTCSVGQFTKIDADLSSAKGATSIEITVLTGTSPTKDTPVWQDFRLTPRIAR
jgi:beta-lactam-binding protein with PASTA domain